MGVREAKSASKERLWWIHFAQTKGGPHATRKLCVSGGSKPATLLGALPPTCSS